MGVQQVLEVSVSEALLGEQEAFVELVQGMAPEDWDRRSLCPPWTIRDVVRHAAFHIHRDGFRQTMGSSAKWEPRLAEEAHADTDPGLLAWLGSPVPAKAADDEINLDEIVIHQLDVRRPLGVPRTIPEPVVRRVLDHCTSFGGNLFAVGRLRKLGRGLQLSATDIDWTSGTGPLVTGTAEDLLLAIAGREGAYAHLEGPGVEVMARRHQEEWCAT